MGEVVARGRVGMRLWALVLCAGMVFVCAMVFSQEARAADFVVSTGDDPEPGTCEAGDCSLREAIAAASDNDEADTITFQDDVQTVTLTRGTLTITSSGGGLLTIDGAGDVTVSGENNGVNRAFVIESGAKARLEGLTISGSEGGGPDNRGTLEVVGSTISGNSTSGAGSRGGGITNSGTLDLEGSTFSENSASGSGGSISNSGTLTVEDSTFSDNSADSGGSIFNDGTLTVEGSTFSDNSAIAGGGIFSQTSAYIEGTTPPEDRTTITNSTFSANSASNTGGAILNDNGYTEINYSTITDNTSLRGAGISSRGTSITAGTRITASIVTGNTTQPDGAGNAADVSNTGVENRAYESGGYNLIGGGDRAGDFDETGDDTGVTVEDAFGTATPTLDDNGGPTQTIALEEGADAIDRVTGTTNPPTPATDQRGVLRASGGAPDSGAFERVPLQQGPEFVVTREDDRDLVCQPDDCSLREAVEAANDTPGNSSITFADDVQTVTLEGTQLPQLTSSSVSGAIRIDGGEDVTIDANDESRVLNVTEGADLTLVGITITGGNSDDRDGGAIYLGDGGALTIQNSTFTDNTTLTPPVDNGDARGGAIFNYLGTLTVEDSTFSQNSAVRGGSIYTESDESTTVSGSTFTDNSAEVSGGAVSSRTNNYSEDDATPPESRTTITNSTLSGNSAGESGGAVRNSNGYTEISYSTVTDNTSPIGAATSSYGDGVTTVRITASIVTGNTDEQGDPQDVSNFPGVERPYESGGYNLIGGGNRADEDFTEPGDQGGVTVAQAFGTENPILQDNGGPTETIAIESDALAYNHVPQGTDSVPQTDQRGIERPQFGASDTGSFELDELPNEAPTISNVPDQRIKENTSTGSLRFTVSDPDDEVTELTVTGRSSNTSLVKQSGIEISGSGENRTVNVTPVRNKTGTTRITLTVEDPEGLTDTETFTVTVTKTPPPSDRCTITGTKRDDVLRGTPRRDVICGLGGNDIISGLGGDDILRGGSGNDIIRGAEDDDELTGGSGRDQLYGQGGNDDLDTKDGVKANDTANGGVGRNSCTTDPGDVKRNCS